MFNDIINEATIISQKNLELNLDKWKDCTNNILYVTGHSGSGKSKYSTDEASKCNAAVIELDKFEYYKYIQKDNPSLGDKLILKYLDIGNNKKLLDEALEYARKNHSFDNFTIQLSKFLDWIVNNLEKDKNNKYIIEGIQLFFICSPSFFLDKNRSLVIINTSILRSIYQKYGIRGDYFNPIKLLKIFTHYRVNESLLNELRCNLHDGNGSCGNKLIESVIISNDNIEFNMDKWEDNTNNILFVIGHSGSGKSTYSIEQAKKYNAISIELDNFDNYEYFNEDTSSYAGNVIILQYINKVANKKKLNKAIKELKEGKTYDNYIVEFDKFFIWLINKLQKDRKHKYIVNGVRMIYRCAPEFFKDRSLTIIGTSIFKSIIQRYIVRGDRINIINIIQLIQSYKLDDEDMDIIRKEMSKSIIKEGDVGMFTDILNKSTILESEILKQKATPFTLFGSLLEGVEQTAQNPNNFDKDNKIQTLESAFGDDPIALKVAYMVATSHEYKEPNVEAALSFVRNYKWKESTMRVDAIEGINKPIIKEKVLEIANSLKKEGKNKWPLVVVDKLQGITPQSPGKKLCIDGHHRKEGLEMAEMKFTPVYLGIYTGDAEKTTEELVLGESDTSNILNEGIFFNKIPDSIWKKVDSLSINELLSKYIKILKSQKVNVVDDEIAISTKKTKLDASEERDFNVDNPGHKYKSPYKIIKVDGISILISTNQNISDDIYYVEKIKENKIKISSILIENIKTAVAKSMNSPIKETFNIDILSSEYSNTLIEGTTRDANAIYSKYAALFDTYNKERLDARNTNDYNKYIEYGEKGIEAATKLRSELSAIPESYFKNVLAMLWGFFSGTYAIKKYYTNLLKANGIMPETQKGYGNIKKQTLIISAESAIRTVRQELEYVKVLKAKKLPLTMLDNWTPSVEQIKEDTSELIPSESDILTEGMFISTNKGKIKVSENIETIETAIKNGLSMVEKFIPLLNNYLTAIDKSYDNKLVDVAKKFYKDAIQLDYDRGTTDELKKQSAAYLKLRMNKVFNHADYKSDSISSKLKEFDKKCCRNGEYANKVGKLLQDLKDVKSRLDAISEKFKKNNASDEQMKLIRLAYSEFGFFADQLALYTGDMMGFLKSHYIKLESAIILEGIDTISLTPEERKAVEDKYGKTACTFAKNSKNGKYFCHTGRVRSNYYDSPTDIPKGDVAFVSSTD